MNPRQRTTQKLATETGISETDAVELLIKVNWSYESALAQFHRDQGLDKVDNQDEAKKKISSIFDGFQDAKDPGFMNIAQVERFAHTIGIDPYNDVEMLYICHTMGCEVMGTISKNEFIQGFLTLSITSLTELRGCLPSLRQKYKDVNHFRGFMDWVYRFNCGHGEKRAPLSVLKELLPLLIDESKWARINDFVEFLDDIMVQNKTISRDCWNQIIPFASRTSPTLEDYCFSTSAWPSLLDEFVTWYLKKKGEV